jgi:hypothetical protein
MSEIVLELSFIAKSVGVVEDSLATSQTILLLSFVFELRPSAANCEFIVVVDIPQHFTD